jgi:hypothetical protein
MKSYLLAAGFALTISGAAMADTPNNETPRLDLREANLQTRITQGLTSGALTVVEAERLQNGLIRLLAGEDLAKADGVVTNRERARLEHGADLLSRAIARQKSDRQTDRNHDGQPDRPVRRH